MLQLLLPALIPSWRFFDRVGPSPRIEYALEPSTGGAGPSWREVRPKPERVHPGMMLVGLFWNPRRNESLYLVSCAERLLDDPTPQRAAELWNRTAEIVCLDGGITTGATDLFLRVRIVEVTREDGCLVRHTVFVSDARCLRGRREERAR